MIKLDIALIRKLRELDYTKVETYLNDAVKSISPASSMASYAIAYVLAKADENENAALETLDSFISTCKIGEEIALFLNDNLRGIWDAVTRARGVFDADMYRAFLIFDEILEYRGGMDYTPTSIAKLAISILEPKNNDKIADYCTGKGGFIRECIMTAPEAAYYGNEINLNIRAIALLRADILGTDINVELCNALEIDFAKHKYDKIFSNYPFMLRSMDISGVSNTAVQFLNKVLPVMRKSVTSDWLFNTTIINTLNDGGKGVAVSVPSTMWNTPEREVRKFFVDNGYIEAVISLPARLFEGTAIKTVMYVFSQNNKSIKFIEASDMFEKGRRQNVLTDENIAEILSSYKEDGKHSKTIAADKLNDYMLDPMAYMGNEIEIKDGAPLETVIKSITRGAQFKASELDELISEDPTQTQYLTLSDVKNGQISENLSYISDLDDSYSKYYLKNDDIIISKNGVPVKVAVASIEEGQKILANGNLYVIEPDKEKINPYFLKAFFESRKGIAVLEKICVGTAIKNISMDAMKKLVVPVPPMEEQNKIANEYLAALDELKVLNARIAKAENRLKNIYDESGVD